MDEIKFLDLSHVHQKLESEIAVGIRHILRSGRFLNGPSVALFETKFAEFCGVPNCVGVGSGLDALLLILKALDIGEGDEVIVPVHTFIATWLAVSHSGASVIPADVCDDSLLIDPAKIEEKLTKNTKAIIAVHLYGQSCDMNLLVDIADRYGVALIEDAAQAHGASLAGKPVGGLGTAAAFSFYPGKNLGGIGNGGCVTTPDMHLAKRIKLLSEYGSRQKYEHEEHGINSRLDEIQAHVLLVKLRYLKDWNELRVRQAAIYLSELSGFVKLPCVLPFRHHVWHLFVIRVKKTEKHNRDGLRRFLADRGIETQIHYPVSCGWQPAYGQIDKNSVEIVHGQLIADQVLSLPIGPHLEIVDIHQICTIVKLYFAD